VVYVRDGNDSRKDYECRLNYKVVRSAGYLAIIIRFVIASLIMFHVEHFRSMTPIASSGRAECQDSLSYTAPRVLGADGSETRLHSAFDDSQFSLQSLS
jgi:hypothetical protein